MTKHKVPKFKPFPNPKPPARHTVHLLSPTVHCPFNRFPNYEPTADLCLPSLLSGPAVAIL